MQVMWLIEVSMLITFEGVLDWALIMGSTSPVGVVIIVVTIMVVVK